MPEFKIPENITVHLGTPSSYAQNVTVPFSDYVKNVASSEIYPTWPENALRANIYAQITFVLNRVFTEHYRSRGYNFDITNSTAYDQFFVPNRDYFESISNIVDEIFNSYIQRQGTVGPIFSSYCNGTTVTCNGLSQWGTVPLANNGYTPYRILQNYYGDDIDIVRNVAVAPNVPSFSGTPIKIGDTSADVTAIQSRLNSIANNYPSIPLIYPVDGIFGERTLSAVKEFQRIFGLTVDGVVGSATWYKLIFINNAVRRLAELDSIGLTIEEYNQQYPDAVRPGDSGDSVKVLQYYLAVIGAYYNELPPVNITGVYDPETQNAVLAFQKSFNLNPSGIVGDKDWQEIYRVFLGVLPFYREDARDNKINEGQFPGYTLMKENKEDNQNATKPENNSDRIRLLQSYLRRIAIEDTNIPMVSIDGIYESETASAVSAFQGLYNLPVTGDTDEATWNLIYARYLEIVEFFRPSPCVNIFANSSMPLNIGVSSYEIYFAQVMIKRIAEKYKNIPDVDVSGTIDQNTSDALNKIKDISGLNPNDTSTKNTFNALISVYESLFKQ